MIIKWNKQKFFIIILFFFFFVFALIFFAPSFLKNNLLKEKREIILCTTSIIANSVSQLVEGLPILVHELMGPGVDPHLYKACPKDIDYLNRASVVIYNGLHLEGKMIDIFDGLRDKRKDCVIISIGNIVLNAFKNNIPEISLRFSGYSEMYDPHIWFDVILWRYVVAALTEILAEKFPMFAESILCNGENFLKKLDDLHKWIIFKISSLPKKKRVLITAHDAFGYFGQRYDFVVEAIQGISTDAEVTAGDIERIITLLQEGEVRTIFVEDSVSKKYVMAIKNFMDTKEKIIKVGKQLYSDALGCKGSGSDTYIGMVKNNVTNIVDGLL